jgi:UDP-N-acetylglucosamine/UDP-N-acetylgalactosamine diphosphorylase
MTNFETLKESLSRHGQEHLLRFWEELTDSERKQLISDIQELNLAEVNSFFKRATASLQESSEKLDDRLKPVPEETFMSISRTSKDLLKIYEDEGEKF